MSVRPLPQDTRFNIFVIGDNPSIEKMFSDRQYTIVDNPDDAYTLVWTGGADIDPQLYGETPINETGRPNNKRDAEEMEFFHDYAHKFKVGICRGAQFLNVMNGGRLVQHVNNHGRTHLVFTPDHPLGVPCTSTHHQLMVPSTEKNKRPQMLGWAFEASLFKQPFRSTKIKNFSGIPDNPLGSENRFSRDPEILWYPLTRSFCFQPHPEYHLAPCKNLFFDLYEELS